MFEVSESWKRWRQKLLQGQTVTSHHVTSNAIYGEFEDHTEFTITTRSFYAELNQWKSSIQILKKYQISNPHALEEKNATLSKTIAKQQV